MSDAQWEVVTTILWSLASIVWAVAYFWRTWLWSVQKEEIKFLKDALDSAIRMAEDMKFSRDEAYEDFKTQERLYAELKEKYKILEAVRMAAVTALTTKQIER